MIASPQPIQKKPLTDPAVEKERKLRIMMRELGSVLVAYSGGVDSTYLALIATQELGSKAVCVLGISPSVAGVQREAAATSAADCGFNFHTIRTDEMNIAEYSANPGDRCYFCKTELFEKLTELALEQNLACVADGTNADDFIGHRPGRAAAEERSVRSPLLEAGMTKADIRQLSKTHGLPGWNKPASPCLSSRIAYGVPVTIERLSRIEEGEEFIRGLGIREFRLRVHGGDLARVEIAPGELSSVLNQNALLKISAKLKALGFRYVTLDMDGYRSGAMNESLITTTNN